MQCWGRGSQRQCRQGGGPSSLWGSRTRAEAWRPAHAAGSRVLSSCCRTAEDSVRDTPPHPCCHRPTPSLSTHSVPAKRAGGRPAGRAGGRAGTAGARTELLCGLAWPAATVLSAPFAHRHRACPAGHCAVRWRGGRRLHRFARQRGALRRSARPAHRLVRQLRGAQGPEEPRGLPALPDQAHGGPGCRAHHHAECAPPRLSGPSAQRAAC